MKLRIAVVAMALGLCALSHAVCQTRDETPAQLSQSHTYAIGQSTCGVATSGIYCFGVPATEAGQTPATFWIDSSSASHFIAFSEGLASLSEATIKQDASYQPTYGTVSYTTPDGRHWTSTQITSLSLTYYGTDSTGKAYVGAMTISLDYYYSDVCSGRGCHTGWYRKVTGGSTTFVPAQ